MKLIKKLPGLNIRFSKRLPVTDLIINAVLPLLFLILISISIFLDGSYGTHYLPLDSEKRIYIILFLFLLWFLKFLLLDLETLNIFQHKNLSLRKKLKFLYSHFHGALHFLKQTKIIKEDQRTPLNQLPWYLLIGPSRSGKTSLLAYSKVNFLLRPQFAKRSSESRPEGTQTDDFFSIETSEYCEWWITRDFTILDVPGNYLKATTVSKQNLNIFDYSVLWHFFLRLTRKHRGKRAFNMLLLVLPLPEMMLENDPKKYHALIHHLLERVAEIQKNFYHAVPCHIIITKCDLIPGFTEFFAESGNDEITQVWGVNTGETIVEGTTAEHFSQRLDALIKKLNQQLLWRLHQERNSMARPYIKDFPLQMERAKELIIEFMKKYESNHFIFPIKAVYFTSALQPTPEPKEAVFNNVTTSTTQSLQIFQQPKTVSRAYFVRQMIMQAWQEKVITIRRPTAMNRWRKGMVYACSICLIAMIAVILGKDFKLGVQETNFLQNEFSNYQIAIQKTQDPDDHLVQATHLLDTLHPVTEDGFSLFNLKKLFSFYSNKSQQKKALLYQTALKIVLLPEIKNYFEDYLKNPVNKNHEDVYEVLRAYLMLGNSKYFNANLILHTFQDILPRSFEKIDTSHLLHHLSYALQGTWRPLLLNTSAIQDTRRYLVALPSFQLSYIILKNLHDNSAMHPINLGFSSNKNNVFESRLSLTSIPKMFLGPTFFNVITQDVISAAEEATLGNWVVGSLDIGNSTEFSMVLTEQLRIAYMNKYIEVWENILEQIKLKPVQDLHQLDQMITALSSTTSPLLQLLQTLHDNTYFEPIISTSTKLEKMSALMEKNQNQKHLFAILTGLQNLHRSLHEVLQASNTKKAAFEIVSNRMQHLDKPDAIMQLRLLAEKSPEPLQTWLNTIANETWHFLMQEATHYLDTSWFDQVTHFYQLDIADRYPFNLQTNKEIDLEKFTKFFGNPGILINFYNQYLLPFIDITSSDSHWKNVENEKLPFSSDTLKRIQQALDIHKLFFPNADNKLYIQFALQPYQISKKVKRVKVSINDKEIVDEKNESKIPHVIAWPNTNQNKQSSIELTMDNQKKISRDFLGEWGWFKLVNETLESTLSKKQLLMNFSPNHQQPVKYYLFTEGQNNPFLALNLQKFSLPNTLISSKN